MQKKKLLNYKNMFGRKVSWDVCCAQCGEVIQDPKEANIELQRDIWTRALTGVYVAHKKCDSQFRAERKGSSVGWNDFWSLTNPVTYMKAVYGLFLEIGSAKAMPTKEAIDQINELLRKTAPNVLRDFTEEEKQEALEWMEVDRRFRLN